MNYRNKIKKKKKKMQYLDEDNGLVLFELKINHV